MRRELLLIALLLTIVHPDFARPQSLSPTLVPRSKSSRIDLKGLTKKAESRDTVAQFKLGYAYQFGQGVDKDEYEAIRWYRMAANYGDSSAQTNLGYIYENGPEGVQDLAEAAKWYMRGAVSGSPEAAQLMKDDLEHRAEVAVPVSLGKNRKW